MYKTQIKEILKLYIIFWLNKGTEAGDYYNNLTLN